METGAVLRRRNIMIIAAAIIIGAVAIGIAVYFITRPRNVVEAVFVNEEPRIDGAGNEAVWAKAEETLIPDDKGNTVSLKALYTPDKVSFLAKFKAAKKTDIDRVWIYDGKNWQAGPFADQIAFFFDIEDSVKDFPSKGFGVITQGLKPGMDMWTLAILGKTPKKGTWDGANQKADYWLWGAGVTNPWGKVDDLYFSVDRSFVLSPTTAPPIVAAHWDAFQSTGLVRVNVNVWQQAINVSEEKTATSVTTLAPVYGYASGLSIETNPYPDINQMVDLTDVSKKGDKVPFIYFNRESKGLWGGSRDDIDGKGVWKNGEWTVEFTRKLNTGNDDDIVFKPDDTETAYYFGILTRTDGKNVDKGDPAILRFLPKGG